MRIQPADKYALVIPEYISRAFLNTAKEHTNASLICKLDGDGDYSMRFNSCSDSIRLHGNIRSLEPDRGFYNALYKIEAIEKELALFKNHLISNVAPNIYNAIQHGAAGISEENQRSWCNDFVRFFVRNGQLRNLKPFYWTDLRSADLRNSSAAGSSPAEPPQMAQRAPSAPPGGGSAAAALHFGNGRVEQFVPFVPSNTTAFEPRTPPDSMCRERGEWTDADGATFRQRVEQAETRRETSARGVFRDGSHAEMFIPEIVTPHTQRPSAVLLANKTSWSTEKPRMETPPFQMPLAEKTIAEMKEEQWKTIHSDYFYKALQEIELIVSCDPTTHVDPTLRRIKEVLMKKGFAVTPSVLIQEHPLEEDIPPVTAYYPPVAQKEPAPKKNGAPSANITVRDSDGKDVAIPLSVFSDIYTTFMNVPASAPAPVPVPVAETLKSAGVKPEKTNSSNHSSSAPATTPDRNICNILFESALELSEILYAPFPAESFGAAREFIDKILKKASAKLEQNYRSNHPSSVVAADSLTDYNHLTHEPKISLSDDELNAVCDELNAACDNIILVNSYKHYGR